LVVPCDMPLVTAAELSPLLEAVARGADAAFYRVEDRDQPLCAAYSVRCVRAAHAALERGQRRVVALLDGTGADGRGLRVQRLDPGEKSAGRLMNVNAPEDYDRARAIYPV
ncbi:MAG: NTP transferase domain-containing protein, partial [Planctomycetota bacterium]